MHWSGVSTRGLDRTSTDPSALCETYMSPCTSTSGGGGAIGIFFLCCMECACSHACCSHSAHLYCESAEFCEASQKPRSAINLREGKSITRWKQTLSYGITRQKPPSPYFFPCFRGVLVVTSTEILPILLIQSGFNVTWQPSANPPASFVSLEDSCMSSPNFIAILRNLELSMESQMQRMVPSDFPRPRSPKSAQKMWPRIQRL
jgi:hypothetical protein